MVRRLGDGGAGIARTLEAAALMERVMYGRAPGFTYSNWHRPEALGLHVARRLRLPGAEGAVELLMLRLAGRLEAMDPSGDGSGGIAEVEAVTDLLTGGAWKAIARMGNAADGPAATPLTTGVVETLVRNFARMVREGTLPADHVGPVCEWFERVMYGKDPDYAASGWYRPEALGRHLMAQLDLPCTVDAMRDLMEELASDLQQGCDPCPPDEWAEIATAYVLDKLTGGAWGVVAGLRAGLPRMER